MRMRTLAVAGFVLFPTWAHAAETLDGNAVRKLLTDNTVNGLRPDGNTVKIHFATDGKVYRQEGGKIVEGTWNVSDDGKQCVAGIPGGCARIIRNDDGTHDRITADGKVLLKWVSFVKGKDF